MYVLLFDVDGTLVNTGRAGGAALMSAFSAVFDVDDPVSVPFSGRTDRGISGALFRHHGVENTTENWHRLREEYLRRLPTLLRERDGRVLPGISQFLGRIAERDDITVGLLTGNSQAGARIKLEYYELAHHFSFGGYGDTHPSRDDVAGASLEAAREYLQSDVSPESTWVIGDTPMDVQCARAIGAHAVAVATGGDPYDDLAQAGPDLLLEDFQNAAGFWRLLR